LRFLGLLWQLPAFLARASVSIFSASNGTGGNSEVFVLKSGTLQLHPQDNPVFSLARIFQPFVIAAWRLSEIQRFNPSFFLKSVRLVCGF
jgi:hypothetical protein